MATRSNKESNKADEFADTVKESAQQIWLAGLGAFSKAQEQGGKVFEALVKEGVAMQRKTQAAAEEKFSQATQRMTETSGQWDKLENIFEDRVSRALNRLGVPSSRDIATLAARVDELEQRVAKLGAPREAARKTATAAKKPTKRAPRKSA